MTNADFERKVNSSDKWILSRTGIKERRIADDDTVPSDMALFASEKALQMAGTSAEEIDLVIVGTVTPDYRLPSTACALQEKTGLTNGAGAAVVAPAENGCGVLSTLLKSDGRIREWLWIPAGGVTRPQTPGFPFDGSDKILMNGSDVFRVAVREMCRAAETVLDKAELTPDDLGLVGPHQANIRIIDVLAKRLKVGSDMVFRNIESYGNTSAHRLRLPWMKLTARAESMTATIFSWLPSAAG